MSSFHIRKATVADCSTILQFIVTLAKYEKLEDEVVATEEKLRQSLFEGKSYAEVILGFESDKAVGFALFFHNYSTFLAKPGIYLEDLFVAPECRGKGYGKAFLQTLAQYAVERDCGRLEWSVLDWNKPSIDFYLGMGAKAMDEWTTFRLTGDALKKVAGS